jgi:AcrR family transcriptional regulator
VAKCETIAPDLLERAFAQIAERGLGGFSRSELARSAGVSLEDVYTLFPDRAALARRLGERLDREMLGMDVAELAGLTLRERVFELVMRRLDALQPYREGLKRLARESFADPRMTLASLCNLDRLGDWLLDIAGLGSGLRARAVAKPALLFVYVRVFGVWLGDETPDRAETMATLDRLLGRIEPLVTLTARRPAATAGPQAAAGDAAA